MNDTVISKSAALKMMDKYIDMAGDDDQMHHAMCVVVEGIKELPTLDVEPVIHAKWIEDGYCEKPSVCSHCGEEAFYISTFRELFDYDWNENLVSCGYEEDREYVHSKRCHNCGAIMDYEEDENAAD